MSWKPPNQSVDGYRIEYKKDDEPFKELPIKTITKLNFTISAESGCIYRVAEICAERDHPASKLALMYTIYIITVITT